MRVGIADRTMTAGTRLVRCARMSVLCAQLFSGMYYFGPAQAATEYSGDSVKAAYLYRFAGYVDWPDTADSSKRFIIAVVDSPGVARELKRLAAGHQINNRPVEVVEAGRIVEQGTHGELYAARGRYYDLYTKQHGIEANLFLAPGEGEEQPAADGARAAQASGTNVLSEAVRLLRG